MGRSHRSKNNKKKNNPAYIVKQEERLSVKAERNAIKQQKRRDSKKAKILGTMEKRYLIGVYDSTRRKGRSHAHLLPSVGSQYIGNFDTEPLFHLYSFEDDTFCGIKHGGNNSINIEVYNVTEDVMDNLDSFNSYDPSQNDKANDYLREKMNSPYGEIEVWIYNNETLTEKPLENGDWIDYVETNIGRSPIITKAERKAALQDLLDKSEIELSEEIEEIEESYEPGKIVNFVDFMGKQDEIKVVVSEKPVNNDLVEARKIIEKSKTKSPTKQDIKMIQGLYSEDLQEDIDKEFMD